MMPADISMFPCRKFAAPEMFGLIPNIQGKIFLRAGTDAQQTSSGALRFSDRGDSVQTVSVLDTTGGSVSINFSANEGNSIYRGSTLQQKALSVLPCIRC